MYVRCIKVLFKFSKAMLYKVKLRKWLSKCYCKYWFIFGSTLTPINITKQHVKDLPKWEASRSQPTTGDPSSTAQRIVKKTKYLNSRKKSVYDSNKKKNHQEIALLFFNYLKFLLWK